MGHAKCRCYTGWTSYTTSLSRLDSTNSECQVQVSSSCPRKNLCDSNADCIRSAQLLDLEGVTKSVKKSVKESLKKQYKSTNSGYSCVCKTGYHLPEENTILPLDGSVCLKNTILEEENSKKVHFTKNSSVVSRYEEFSDITTEVYHLENFVKIGDREYRNWYVSDNGVFVLFNGENNFGNVFSENMPSFYDNSEKIGKNYQIIAPYWHDLDPYTLNNVTSITVSVDSYESKMLVSRECGMDVRPVRFSVVVTWRRMSNFPKPEKYNPKEQQADNTFQLVLATDGVDTCAVFNYSAFLMFIGVF